MTRPPTLLHVPLLRASLTTKASKVASTDTIHIISVPSQTIYIWRLCKGMLHAMGTDHKQFYCAARAYIFIHPRVHDISRVHGFCTSCFSFEVWLHHKMK